MKFSLLSIVVIVLSSMICVYGQKETSLVCRDAEAELTKEFQKWTKTMRLFGDACMIHLQMRDDFIRVDIDGYETIEESRSAFSRNFDYLTLAETYPKAVKYIKNRTFWNESKGFNHDSDSDHLIMLRYKRILITLIGSKYKHLLRIEPVLGRIDFNGTTIK